MAGDQKATLHGVVFDILVGQAEPGLGLAGSQGGWEPKTIGKTGPYALPGPSHRTLSHAHSRAPVAGMTASE